jgi:hypothetical protein
MFRTIIAASSLTLASLVFAPASQAQVSPAADGQFAASVAVAQDQGSAEDRLMIVNRNTGHVIYDDGRCDLFCSPGAYPINSGSSWVSPLLVSSW